MEFNLTVVIVVAVYMLAMLFIGWYSSTRITSNSDFMVAGRRLGPLLMAGILAATGIGGGSSLGVIVLALMSMGIFDAAEFADVGACYALPVLAMPSLISPQKGEDH